MVIRPSLYQYFVLQMKPFVKWVLSPHVIFLRMYDLKHMCTVRWLKLVICTSVPFRMVINDINLRNFKTLIHYHEHVINKVSWLPILSLNLLRSLNAQAVIH